MKYERRRKMIEPIKPIKSDFWGDKREHSTLIPQETLRSLPRLDKEQAKCFSFVLANTIKHLTENIEKLQQQIKEL